MNALTLEVILRVVFGVTDETRLRRLRPLVEQLVRIPPAVLLGWGRPGLARLGPWRRMVENQYALDELLFAEIAQRRQAPDLAERSDVLSRLIVAGASPGAPGAEAGAQAGAQAGTDAGAALDDVELRD